MPFGRPAQPLAAMRAKRIRQGSDELRRWNASASTVGSQSAAMFNLWGVDGMPIYACGQPTLDGAMAVVHKVRRALADASAARRFRQCPRGCCAFARSAVRPADRQPWRGAA